MQDVAVRPRTINTVMVIDPLETRRGWYRDTQRVPPDNREDILWVFYSDAGIPIAIICGDGRNWRVRTAPLPGRQLKPLDCAIDMHGSTEAQARTEAEIMMRSNGRIIEETTVSGAPA